MAQARGSAISTIATFIVLLWLQCEISFATKYTVGDAGGWTFGVSNWTQGKTFKVGDVLEFNYVPRHNVVAVDQEGYKKCQVKPGDKIYNSGRDQIKIKGQSFFICGVPGHCASGGMKLAISVAACV